MITQEQYSEIRARLAILETWVDSLRTKTKCRKCSGSGKVNWKLETCPNGREPITAEEFQSYYGIEGVHFNVCG